MSGLENQVLIVDDENFFLEAIDEILTEAGLDTLRADTAKSALAQVEDASVGVVVLDVRLPDMDGIQVLARIRETRPELPVIMLSASTDQEIVLEALRLGACDYLAKPLHDEELVLAVGRALQGFEANAERQRLKLRIDRLVEGMERLSQIVRLADPAERAEVLRQGIVDSASVIFGTARSSLMLSDPSREWLSVVATRGAGVTRETMTPRKIGEAASGTCFSEGQVLCVSDAGGDARFAGRAAGEYLSSVFAVVPLVCLGVPVGVLCLTESENESSLSSEEANVLRLMGMQVSEFLAADPEVERLLAEAQGVEMGLEVEPLDLVEAVDGDAELARSVCEAVAADVEPARVLKAALGGVATRLGAAQVSLYLADSGGERLVLEAEAEGGGGGDRRLLPLDRGLLGSVYSQGHLVATDRPAAEGRFDQAIDTPSDGLARPILCVPIRLRNRTVGVLRVFLEEGQVASSRTAEVLGAAFSAAVRNVLLYRSLVQSVEEVADARRQARVDVPLAGA